MIPKRVVYPIEEIRRSKRRKVRKALKLLEKYALTRKKSKDFPHTLVFDWNGTIDARNTGTGIPLSVLDSLKALKKNVIIFTSSVDSDGKEFMRHVCNQHGIPYTSNEKILKKADMFVGDKHSDEKTAGHYGAKFVYVKKFSLKDIAPRGK